MKTEILFENNDILVVYKPAGIATQTSKVGEKDVVSELKNYLKGGYVGLIHRLDQPVEGLLVFAKNSNAAGKLSAQVKAKGIEGDESAFCKEYLAVVLGEPKEAKGRLENLMIKTPERTARIVGESSSEAAGSVSEVARSASETMVSAADVQGAKKAILNYELLETKKVGEYTISLVRIHLETGRFHQIRAQLANIGCPIIGDRKYGNSESIKCADELRVRNVSLCADRLVFAMPNAKAGTLSEYSHKPMGSLFSEFTKLP